VKAHRAKHMYDSHRTEAAKVHNADSVGNVGRAGCRGDGPARYTWEEGEAVHKYTERASTSGLKHFEAIKTLTSEVHTMSDLLKGSKHSSQYICYSSRLWLQSGKFPNFHALHSLWLAPL
jgi:hypothetical protein